MALWAKQALLPEGWAASVRIQWDSTGCIDAIETGVSAQASDECVDHVIPGMPNLHSHAFQRAMAGLTEYRANANDSFWTWRDLMYRFAAKLTPEHVQAIAAQLYAEMLQTGYTSVAEFHYLHHQANGCFYDDPSEMSQRIFAAAEQTGIGLTHLPVLYRYSGFGERTPKSGQQRFLHNMDAYTALVQNLHKQCEGKRTVIGIAPHSLRAVNRDMLVDAVNMISELNAHAPIHIHIAEQELEVQDSLTHSGARPVQWLLEHAPVDQRWCLVHATHLTDDEVQRAAKTGAVAGVCTTTEANLGDGFFRTREWLTQGGLIGFGSDSHISVSVTEELRWLEYAARLQQRERAVLCRDTQSVGRFMYQQALRGGAAALAQAVGKIENGYYADLVVLNTDHPLLCHRTPDAVLDSYLFAGNQNVVQHVMVNGRWQVRDGKHIHAEELNRNYQATVNALLA